MVPTVSHCASVTGVGLSANGYEIEELRELPCDLFCEETRIELRTESVCRIEEFKEVIVEFVSREGG